MPSRLVFLCDSTLVPIDCITPIMNDYHSYWLLEAFFVGELISIELLECGRGIPRFLGMKRIQITLIHQGSSSRV